MSNVSAGHARFPGLEVKMQEVCRFFGAPLGGAPSAGARGHTTGGTTDTRLRPLAARLIDQHTPKTLKNTPRRPTDGLKQRNHPTHAHTQPHTGPRAPRGTTTTGQPTATAKGGPATAGENHDTLWGEHEFIYGL